MKKVTKEGGGHDDDERGNNDGNDDATVAKKPDSIDEIGGQLGFSAPNQRPRDFNSF